MSNRITLIPGSMHRTTAPVELQRTSGHLALVVAELLVRHEKITRRGHQHRGIVLVGFGGGDRKAGDLAVAIDGRSDDVATAVEPFRAPDDDIALAVGGDVGTR